MARSAPCRVATLDAETERYIATTVLTPVTAMAGTNRVNINVGCLDI
jgi:hypothetical protein